mmetsp:Transcript_14510/g.22109  ORF Transcript_14510/g.22109 Transcript_14510/m.22109 type:complete len:255 (-) Transcript_14510:167-931(-)
MYSKKDTPHKTPTMHNRFLFKMGPLRFGFHGIWAMLTFTATCICIATPYNSILLFATMVFNEGLAIHAYSLMDQVPLSTKICKGFTAPHREAFKRTIAMMHYTNLRLLQSLGIPDFLYLILLPFSWRQFWPFTSDFSNGNTWIFVVPMFVGVSLDMMQSLFTKYYCGSEYDLVSWQWLLGVHLSAMIMAFAFTLAFRGMISIQLIYFGAAFFVALLFVSGCLLIFFSPAQALSCSAIIAAATTTERRSNHPFLF